MMPTAAPAGHLLAFCGRASNCTWTVFYDRPFFVHFPRHSCLQHTEKCFIAFEVHNLHGHGSGQFFGLQALKILKRWKYFSISEGPNITSHYWPAFSCCIRLTPSVAFLSLCRLRSTACLWFCVSVFLLSASHESRRSLKTDPLLANIQYFICSKLCTSSFI